MPWFKETPKLFKHQQQTVDFLKYKVAGFDTSDPGTGKTRSNLQDFWERRRYGGGKCLVIAPKSILQPAWGADIDKFFPGMSYIVAYAHNRVKAFKTKNMDVYITNHDAVTWMAKNLKISYWDDFDTLIVDESTAYKNHTAQRSKAIKKLVKYFSYRRLLSGTPNPNSVTELWHQALLLDDGERLGDRFYAFRAAVCEPKQVGPSAQHIQWADKDGAEAAVFDLLEDITIRHKLEECVDMPENVNYNVEFDLPAKLRVQYQLMRDQSFTVSNDGKPITGVHASAVNTKLLQIASGAVYSDGEEGSYEVLDDARTDLIIELLEERDHSLVLFNWKHQRDRLVEACKKKKWAYAVIDGEAKDADRLKAVQDFQAGKLKVILAHPKSAGHGLTLTKGATTIWASPTYSSEQYKQANHRLYRASQTRRTETINIIAKDTVDQKVLDKLNGKLTSMQIFLQLMEEKELEDE